MKTTSPGLDQLQAEFNEAFRDLRQFAVIGAGHGHEIVFQPGLWRPRALLPARHYLEAPIGEALMGRYHLARERLNVAKACRRIKTAGRRPAFDPASRPWNGRSFAS